MITIYHLNNSRSERVIWLMEELGLPYELERFQREPDMRSPAALRTVHPLGKSPVIQDGDVQLVESGAILEYIANRYGDGRLTVPVEASNYPNYLQWMHFAEGSAMLQLLMHLVVGGFFVPDMDQTQPAVIGIKQGTAGVLRYIDDELAKTPYFAGREFTCADIMMMYCFGIVRGYLKTDMSLYRNISDWLDSMESRPAYRKAMEIAK